MLSKSGEFERVYQTVVNDLDKWDGQQPLEDFVAEILEKRLLLDKEEAKAKAEELLTGIENYKRAKELIQKNPEIVERAIGNVDKNLLKDFIAKILNLFKSIKGISDGK